MLYQLRFDLERFPTISPTMYHLEAVLHYLVRRLRMRAWSIARRAAASCGQEVIVQVWPHAALEEGRRGAQDIVLATNISISRHNVD